MRRVMQAVRSTTVHLRRDQSACSPAQLQTCRHKAEHVHVISLEMGRASVTGGRAGNRCKCVSDVENVLCKPGNLDKTRPQLELLEESFPIRVHSLPSSDWLSCFTKSHRWKHLAVFSPRQKYPLRKRCPECLRPS